MSSIVISKRYRWEMGHRLMHHKGKCRNLHGHSYTAEVYLRAPVDWQTGMVIDYYEMKPLGRWIDDNLDHAFMLNVDDREGALACNAVPGQRTVVMNGEPTAENIAALIAKEARNLLENSRVHVEIVKVKETETTSAVWRAKA